jgi:putative cell wall-binding protein
MGATSVKIVGGANAVSGTQESGFRGAGLGITRLSGSDRIGTSIAINDDAFPSASTVYLATAVDYPDALAGAAAAGKAKSPLFVSFPGCMPAATRDSITSRQTSSLLLLGGTSALSPTVAQLGRC